MPRSSQNRWGRGWRSLRGRRLPLVAGGLLFGLLLLAVWLVRPFWRLSSQFAEDGATGLEAQPSRLYGRPLALAAGGSVPRSEVLAELKALEYRAVKDGGALPPGSYREAKDRLEVHLRSFPTPAGIHPGGPLLMTYQGARVKSLSLGGQPVESSTLEPPLLASFMGPRFLERRPVRVEELPDHLVRAVLAAEDDQFFRHGGLSASGILRAAWRNVRGGEVRQGGSTLTQQLVKNLYLTRERTWARKAQEAVLALIVELRYSKREILQAYLNEIYLGQSGGVNLLGVGAAARAYFGEEPARLDLAQAAVLAGMIASPGDYSPLAHPERSRERRDWVLGRLRELRWAEPAAIEAALAAPLATAPQRVVHRRAPYFADAMAAEAARRFAVPKLEDRGYTLFSTLAWRDQQKAEEAVAWGIEQIEKGWQKGRPGRLQAALVSVDPRSGEILAYLGGRSYKETQFDRAGQALRQAGSAFKPVVYAAAFEGGAATPATLLEDAPLTVTLTNAVWTPRNDDETFRGWVTARQAVEHSLNIPTARLALQVGLRRVVNVARRMGVTNPLQAVPSLALGAFEVTPVELATVYATLANGGLRPPVHGLTAVVDAHGRGVAGEPLPEPERALSPQVAYIVNTVLQGVLDRGTGAAVRAHGVRDALAGKTGTTNGRRDSWFGGYAPSRATLVWVGYDDNSATRLSGARAALPIWARFTAKVRPPGGFPRFPQPRGVVTAVVDPWSGELATEACPEILTEVFLEGQVPNAVCHLHGGWFADVLAPIPGAPPGSEEARPAERGEYEEVDRRGFRRWLRKVFGKERDDRPRTWKNPPPPPPPPPP